MLEGPCATLYPRVNSQSIPMGHLPEGKSRGESALMDTQDVRRINLRKVIDAEFGGKQARLASHLDLAPPTLSRIFRSGKKVGDVIRDWERKLGYEPGALDRPDFEPGSRFRFGRATARVVEPLALAGNVSGFRPAISWDTEQDLGEDIVTVPRYRMRVSAGTGIVVFDPEERNAPDAFRASSLRELGCVPGKCFVAKVSGDSMDPTAPDGSSILVASNQTDIIDSKIYVVAYNGEIYCKRLFKAGPEVVLRSDNPVYPELRASMSDVQIVGRVVNVSRVV